MTVKRFDISGEHYEVFGDNNGEYCLYEDYAEIQRQLTAYEATVANLTAQVQGLAAENGRLGSAAECLLHEASDVYRAYNKTQLPDGDLVDGQSLQEVYEAINSTPITDAALAEIRAQGVEMFVSSLQKHVDEGDFVGDEIAVITGAIDAGGEFADKLRKEQGK